PDRFLEPFTALGVGSPSTSLEKLCIEGSRKEVAHLDDLRFAFQVGEDDGNVAAEFPDDLPAYAARRRKFFGIGNDCYMFDFSFAFGDGFPDSDAFGANGKAVAG